MVRKCIYIQILNLETSTPQHTFGVRCSVGDPHGERRGRWLNHAPTSELSNPTCPKAMELHTVHPRCTVLKLGTRSGRPLEGLIESMTLGSTESKV
jgi:hypothetical protein